MALCVKKRRANVAWAFAARGVSAPALMRAVSRAACADAEELLRDPHALATTAWAVTTRDCASARALFRAVSEACSLATAPRAAFNTGTVHGIDFSQVSCFISLTELRSF